MTTNRTTDTAYVKAPRPRSPPPQRHAKEELRSIALPSIQWAEPGRGRNSMRLRRASLARPEVKMLWRCCHRAIGPQPHPNFIEVSGSSAVRGGQRALAGAGEDGEWGEDCQRSSGVSKDVMYERSPLLSSFAHIQVNGAGRSRRPQLGVSPVGRFLKQVTPASDSGRT
jgi:hypothetical protein